MSTVAVLFNFFDNLPKNGSKFVAFHSDGSGANLYLRDDAGDFYDAELNAFDKDDFFYSYKYYAYLPDDFEFFGEGNL